MKWYRNHRLWMAVGVIVGIILTNVVGVNLDWDAWILAVATIVEVTVGTVAVKKVK